MADAWRVYGQIQIQYQVPFTLDIYGDLGTASVWAGLDGFHDQSVAQAGYAVLCQCGYAGGCTRQHFTFAEYYPAPSYEIAIQADSFDTVMLVLYGTDSPACTNLNVAGGYVCYYFHNITSGQVAQGVLAALPGYALPGDPAVSSAEWIVERWGGNYALLPFLPITVASAYAMDTGYT